MPPLRLLPMPQRMLKEQEEDFWWGQDMAMGEELELGPPPPTVQLEEAGWQIPVGAGGGAGLRKARPCRLLGWGQWRWMALGRQPEDGAMVGEATDKETDSLLQPS